MAKVRIKKEKSIGSVAAENDRLLDTTFVDLGYVHQLSDTTGPNFLILGRTGVGKTALLERIKASAEHASVLDPEELSMQYLHSSTILKTVLGWGINLEMFYKFLWRHVCILELIRMRYGHEDDVPSTIDRIFNLSDLINRGRKKTKETSRDYLKKYAGDYWVKTDTRIKTIANELSTKLAEDEQVGAKLRVASLLGAASATASSQTQSVQESTTKIDYEVRDRVQNIVSDYLIADLNHVIELLAEHAFNDAQKRYYILVDNLDRDWMPDDELYLDLVKSLINSVMDVNNRLAGVKIIVALRDNIFFRVYKKTAKHEPQREKLADVILSIRWSRPDLIQLVNKRLAATFPESEHMQFADILPAKKKKTSQDPIDYVLDRTFLRPRDVIAFVNAYLEQVTRTSSPAKPTWTSLLHAEATYSKGRLDSVHDEWKDSFYGLPALYKVLDKTKKTFRISDISQDDINTVLLHELCEKCPWLKALQESYAENKATNDDIKEAIIEAAFTTGLIGVKIPSSENVVFSFELPTFTLPWKIEEGSLQEAIFYIHKMFWKAFGITEVES